MENELLFSSSLHCFRKKAPETLLNLEICFSFYVRMKCAMCGKFLGENEVFFGPLGSEHEGRPLCRKCYLILLQKLLYILNFYRHRENEIESNYYKLYYSSLENAYIADENVQ